MTLSREEIMTLDEDGLRFAIAKAKNWPVDHFVDSEGTEHWTWHNVPDYSCSWDAAGELMEEMDNIALVLRLRGGYFAYRFNRPPTFGAEKTGPLAIARAWLLWKNA